MAVEARLYVSQVGKNAYSGVAGKPTGTVTLHASTRGEENKKWAQATPSANFTMTLNSDALAWFDEHLGKDVRVLIQEVPEES